MESISLDSKKHGIVKPAPFDQRCVDDIRGTPEFRTPKLTASIVRNVYTNALLNSDWQLCRWLAARQALLKKLASVPNGGVRGDSTALGAMRTTETPSGVPPIGKWYQTEPSILLKMTSLSSLSLSLLVRIVQLGMLISTRHVDPIFPFPSLRQSRT